jgi:hypothetical protein
VSTSKRREGSARRRPPGFFARIRTCLTPLSPVRVFLLPFGPRRFFEWLENAEEEDEEEGEDDEDEMKDVVKPNNRAKLR